MTLAAGVLAGLSAACGAVGIAGKSGSRVKKEAVLPQDREKIVQPVASVYSPEELALS